MARRLTITALGILTVVIVLSFLLRIQIGHWIGNYLVVDSRLKRSDVVISLATHEFDRILEAVDVYQNGLASKLILNEVPPPSGYDHLTKLGIDTPRLHEIHRAIAMQLGIPGENILIVERIVDSTSSELRGVHKFLTQREIRSAIIVTSTYHTKRTKLIWDSISDGTVEVVIRGSTYNPFESNGWWVSRRDTKAVIYEYLKLLNFYIGML